MHIQIGAIAYELVETPLDNLHGDISTIRCRIRIDADQDSQAKRVTLWHEIIHGILYGAGLREHDEQVVDALAHGIVQVLRDNPQLVAVAQG